MVIVLKMFVMYSTHLLNLLIWEYINVNMIKVERQRAYIGLTQ